MFSAGDQSSTKYSAAVVETCKTIAAWLRRYPEPQYYDLLAIIDAVMREDQAALRAENQRLREALTQIKQFDCGCMFERGPGWNEHDADCPWAVAYEALAQEQRR